MILTKTLLILIISVNYSNQFKQTISHIWVVLIINEPFIHCWKQHQTIQSIIWHVNITYRGYPGSLYNRDSRNSCGNQSYVPIKDNISANHWSVGIHFFLCLNVSHMLWFKRQGPRSFCKWLHKVIFKLKCSETSHSLSKTFKSYIHKIIISRHVSAQPLQFFSPFSLKIVNEIEVELQNTNSPNDHCCSAYVIAWSFVQSECLVHMCKTLSKKLYNKRSQKGKFKMKKAHIVAQTVGLNNSSGKSDRGF